MRILETIRPTLAPTLCRRERGVALRACVALTLAFACIVGFGCEGGDESEKAPVAVVDAGTALSRATVATLRGLKGSVQVERDGQKRAASQEPLFVKDAVETGSDGEAVIAFADGRTVEMGPDARLLLSEDATGLLLEVQQGLVLSRVPATSARPNGTTSGSVQIRILTPFGLTRVGDGESEVAVDVSAASAKVDVKIGEVELVSVNGETTKKAAAGDSVSLTQGAVEILGREEVTTLETIQVTILADGRAEVKKAGSKKWAAVGKTGMAVGAGDSVRVRKGRSTLALEGSSTTLTLEGGGELTFQKSGRGSGGREESQLELRKGSMDVKLARDHKTRVVLGGLQLESDVGGFFTVQKTRSGFDVAAVTGDLVLKKGEKQQGLSAGQLAHVSESGTELGQVLARDRPELVLPSRSAQRVFHPGLPSAVLDWRGEDGDYDVRVAEDARFDRLVAAGRVHRSEVAVPVPRRGLLYWDVKDAKTGKDVDSGSAIFAPEPPLKDLENVRNVVPEGNEKTTIYYQDKPPAVTFTYATEASAAKYRVAVFKQGQLDAPVAERTVSENRAPLEAGLLTEGSYVWSVTPLAGSGEPLRGGKMNKLDLVYDNSVPTLLIQTPRNGERAAGAVRTQGVAPVGSKLFVNGRAIDLDAKSRFDAKVGASGSPPSIIYRLVRPNGADAFYVRVLKRGQR